MDTTALRYQSGFGNDFASEALPGALPVGQSNPQKPPYGLYTEEINGTPFTAPRARRCGAAGRIASALRPCTSRFGQSRVG